MEVERMDRRSVLSAVPVLAGLAGIGRLGPLLAQEDEARLENLVEFQRLVAANRILANEGVVDAFGHVSVRHPDNAQRYVMSQSRSPELVEFDDLMEFEQTGEPVDPRGRRGYGERMIHGAVYEARPDVNAVIHYHAHAVLPFGLTSVPFRPVVHNATVIGRHVPVWDIRDEFGDTDMLVRTMERGRSLARTLEQNTCLLMAGHGAVVVGESVQLAVKAAVYLQGNARVLSEALRLGEPRQFTDGEIELSAAMENSPLGAERAWEYFCLRAGVEPI